jgi:hypothetical protein
MNKFVVAAAAFIAALAMSAAPSEAQAASLTVQTKTPAVNAIVSGSVLWEATVSGGTPARVEFLIDGVLKWTENVSPYRYNGDTGALDTRTLTNGTHTLTARAVATTGETFTNAIAVTVSNGTTTSSLAIVDVSPTAGATLSGSLVWEAKMTAGTASKVDFLIDGAQRWTEGAAPYRFNGDLGTLDTRTLANGTHTLTVRATDSGGKTATSDITVNVSNSATSGTLNRTVYCFGSPTYGTLGWAYDGTSLGWIRQFPAGLPQRVSYDSSVSVMKGLGCETMKAEIQANDPDTTGGTGPQRAQLYTSDTLLTRYGAQPSLGTGRGNYRWYGFAFATNGGYRPQNSTSWPNFNYLFSWHNSGSASAPNVIVGVATASQSGCGQALVPLSQPRVYVEVNGGDPAKYPYAGATCRRFFGPTFVAGSRYTVEMGIKWADNGTGSAAVWINGQQVANATGVSTLWLNEGVYPLFENYRPGKAMIGNLISWTNTVYYGGLLAGPTQADVALPSS